MDAKQHVPQQCGTRDTLAKLGTRRKKGNARKRKDNGQTSWKTVCVNNADQAKVRLINNMLKLKGRKETHRLFLGAAHFYKPCKKATNTDTKDAHLKDSHPF